MPTPPYKVLAANDGLLRHSVPGETLIYKVTGDDTNGTLDVLVLTMQPKSGPQNPHHLYTYGRSATMNRLTKRCSASVLSMIRFLKRILQPQLSDPETISGRTLTTEAEGFVCRMSDGKPLTARARAFADGRLNTLTYADVEPAGAADVARYVFDRAVVSLEHPDKRAAAPLWLQDGVYLFVQLVAGSSL
jgi:hypothetical protein